MMQKIYKNEHSERICVVAGMPRAATTFLYHTLAKHPSIFPPARKELEFFSMNYHRGREWYLSFFEDMCGELIGIDISPMYFFDPRAPERILEFNHEAKVVLILRDPVEFVISLHKLRQAATYEELDFKCFLDGHCYEKDGQTLNLEFMNRAITNSIERFRQAFGDNLLLCDYRLIERDPLPVLSALEHFVGVPHYFNHGNFENTRINASDRINIKLLNQLMNKKWFADVVTRVFPKRLIMYVRYKLQSSKRTSANGTSANPNEANRKLAASYLDPDVEYIENLFHDSSLVLGTGQPYARSSNADRSNPNLTAPQWQPTS